MRYRRLLAARKIVPAESVYGGLVPEPALLQYSAVASGLDENYRTPRPGKGGKWNRRHRLVLWHMRG